MQHMFKDVIFFSVYARDLEYCSQMHLMPGSELASTADHPFQYLYI